MQESNEIEIEKGDRYRIETALPLEFFLDKLIWIFYETWLNAAGSLGNNRRDTMNTNIELLLGENGEEREREGDRVGAIKMRDSHKTHNKQRLYVYWAVPRDSIHNHNRK